MKNREDLKTVIRSRKEDHLPTQEPLNVTKIPILVEKINILSQMLWEIDLFKPRQVQLAHILRPCSDDDFIEFDVHLASLGTYIDSLNSHGIKPLISEEKIKKKYTERSCKLIYDIEIENQLRRLFNLDSDGIIFFEYRPLQSIDYLIMFLEQELGCKDLISRLRDIRRLRNRVHIVHDIDWKEAEKDFGKLGIPYPINDYHAAWVTIVNRFISILDELYKSLSTLKHKRNSAEEFKGGIL